MHHLRGNAGVEEWVRLPGLFSWNEVCVLFSTESGHDDGWRFRVRRASPDRGREPPLYAIYAAEPSKSIERKEL